MDVRDAQFSGTKTSGREMSTIHNRGADCVLPALLRIEFLDARGHRLPVGRAVLIGKHPGPVIIPVRLAANHRATTDLIRATSLPMRVARIAWLLSGAAVLTLALEWGLSFHPPQTEDLPWTRLDLVAPIGMFTASKLAALNRDPALCEALLRGADVRFVALPSRRDGQFCGWVSAVRLRGADRPHVALACPVAAAFEVWMRDVVQPAAAELLSARVSRVENLGSYACRRINGGSGAGISEHATANAIDVTGFRLADGRRVSVARDWAGGARGVFLHRVRDGACRVFATTLSPDFNAAHRDHLHLDEADRGAFGWQTCR